MGAGSENTCWQATQWRVMKAIGCAAGDGGSCSLPTKISVLPRHSGRCLSCIGGNGTVRRCLLLWLLYAVKN